MTDPITNIRNALEAALASITPSIDIAFENVAYEPVNGQPYCEAYLLPATPDNATVGSGFYQELGIFQVILRYPAGMGTLDCATRAGLIRDLFARGRSFTDGGVAVQVDRTPEVRKGEQEEGRWRQDVLIRWHADIFK